MTWDQKALDRASWELQRHFGREGSIYGIKACEEIARIAIVAYWSAQPEAARIVCDISEDDLAKLGEMRPGPIEVVYPRDDIIEECAKECETQKVRWQQGRQHHKISDHDACAEAIRNLKDKCRPQHERSSEAF